MAWGLWAQASGMTGELGEADLARLARTGVGALVRRGGPGSCSTGLASAAEALAVCRPARAGGAARAGRAPGCCRRCCAGWSAAPAAARRRPPRGSLAQRLAGVPEAERERLVLELVRAQVAAVLGHASAEAIDPAAGFKDLGFDSLGAVELRNRLGPGHRAAAAGHAGLRLSDAGGGRRLPAGRGRRGTAGPARTVARAGAAAAATSRSRSSG